MSEVDFVSAKKLIGESEKRTIIKQVFNIYGKRIEFKSDCPEVEQEISKDLKNFVDDSETSDTAVYGFLETDFGSSPLRNPPPGAILVWKSLDHSQFHYQIADTIMMYHTKKEQAVAVTLSFLSHQSSLCFCQDTDTLYELCLFEIEKQAASLLEREGKQLVHASSVEVDGKGMLFPATSGFGKTFLTLVLLNNGHQLLADDKTFIDPAHAMIFPYSRRLRVDRRSAMLFPALKPFLQSAQRHFLNYKAKYLIDAQMVWPESQGSVCPLSYIIFPTIWVESKSKIVPCKTEHELSRLLTSMKLFHQEVTKVQTEAAFELATKVPSYHLLIGTDISGIEKAIRAGLNL